MAILSYLKIDKFRKLPPVTIELGDAITVIAGYNATSKSTLLGMIGQGFGKEDLNFKDFFGNQMVTTFSDLFKMSTSDEPGSHLYHLGLINPLPPHGSEAQVKSRKRGASCRLVTGRLHEVGWGNLPIPVIYLGLKRLYPLGELNEQKGEGLVPPTNAELSDDEKTFCYTWNSILTGDGSADKIQNITSATKSLKQSLAMPNNDYDAIGISSGQDNIGKILAAVLSFSRLKRERPEEYRGGILLIDEVDASLHPSAQRRLIDLLMTARMKYDIQTVVTTHSLSLIEYFINYRSNDANIQKFAKLHPNLRKTVYIYRINGQITIKQSPTWDFISANLQDLIQKHETPKSKDIDVFVEDAEARYVLEVLLPPQIKKRLKFSPTTWGEKELLQVAKFPKMKSSICIADGDAPKKPNSPPNFFWLPGKKSPERELLSFMSSLPEESALWTESFSKRLFLTSQPTSTDRETMKIWFQSLQQAPGKIVFKKFIKAWGESAEVKPTLIELISNLALFLKNN